MSKLRTLRSQLADLRRRRQGLRLGTAVIGTLLAVLWSLASLFVIDWRFELDRPQRVVLIAGALVAIYWAFRRFSFPWLGVRESEEEMALLVERQQHIDSDLVAALQFESPQAAAWGSVQLETAVIDYVADFKDLNVMEGLDTRPFVRRAQLLAGTGLLLGVLAAAFPGHAAAFFNRLLLGSQHYPTRTRIESIAINGQVIFNAADPSVVRNIVPKSAYWEPVRFEVHWSGQPPTEGHVDLRTERSGNETRVKLEATSQVANIFAGQLDRLVDSIQYQIYLGDAWTDLARAQVIPLPVVDVELQVTPPDYAAVAEAPSAPAGGTRQISVVEGSRVAVMLKSDKPLQEATMSIEKKPYSFERVAISPGDGKSAQVETWQLAQEGTPLAQIVEPLKYEIQVTDADGLRLKEPIQGFIRIKADRPPRVTAAIITQHVLPVARPKIDYGAADDYGIAQLRLHRQVVRMDVTDMQDDVVEVIVMDLPQKLVRGQLPVDLAPLRLNKGDQLKLTFEAVDYRGKLMGKSALSEPLILHVTDERGVLAAMVESDERTARQLDAIIQRQLGIGDPP